VGAGGARLMRWGGWRVVVVVGTSEVLWCGVGRGREGGVERLGIGLKAWWVCGWGLVGWVDGQMLGAVTDGGGVASVL